VIKELSQKIKASEEENKHLESELSQSREHLAQCTQYGQQLVASLDKEKASLSLVQHEVSALKDGQTACHCAVS